jgi:poly-gamma-glutamate capsule biosynthesis protein CapA/YwtB (metallophosphatase superfamily)
MYTLLYTEQSYYEKLPKNLSVIRTVTEHHLSEYFILNFIFILYSVGNFLIGTECMNFIKMNSL